MRTICCRMSAVLSILPFLFVLCFVIFEALCCLIWLFNLFDLHLFKYLFSSFNCTVFSYTFLDLGVNKFYLLVYLRCLAHNFELCWRCIMIVSFNCWISFAYCSWRCNICCCNSPCFSSINSCCCSLISCRCSLNSCCCSFCCCCLIIIIYYNFFQIAKWIVFGLLIEVPIVCVVLYSKYLV